MRWLTVSSLFRSHDSDQEIPEIPPASLRGRYLELSRAYLWWCLGMLLWSILCVGYFILTGQMLEMIIGLCLGVLLIAMIIFPATLFGGKTWYKRLGWVTILTSLFAILLFYPLVVVSLGISRRLQDGRYSTWPSFNDTWHLALSILTVVISVWTIRLALKITHLVRKLQRGDYAP